MRSLRPFSGPKSNLASVVTASAYLSRTCRIPLEALHSLVPSRVILCLENGLYRVVRRCCDRSLPRSLPGNLVLLKGSSGGSIGVCGGMGIGAPALALLMEDLVALGVQEFIVIGTAGLLQGIGELSDQERLFVCEQAISDEGTSRHYAERGNTVHASPTLTARLCQGLARRGMKFERSISWSTDAPYRETIAELMHYRGLGVQTVDMEASALFAVAAYKRVNLAIAFAISDAFVGSMWVPYYGSRILRKQLLHLFSGAAEAFDVGFAMNSDAKIRSVSAM